MASENKVKRVLKRPSTGSIRSNAKKRKSKIISDSDSEDIAPPTKRNENVHKQPKVRGNITKAKQVESPTSCNQMGWHVHELLAEVESIDSTVAKHVVKLFDDDNTIPFIARYRQDVTNGMCPEKLRRVKASYELVKNIQKKAEILEKTICEEAPEDVGLLSSVRNARSLAELEYLGAPFKKGSKSTLASRAKNAGLEEHGLMLMKGTANVDPSTLIDPESTGRQNLKDVKNGLQHIIADIISKDSAVLDFLKSLRDKEHIVIQSVLKKNAGENEKGKYSLYHNFSQSVKNIKDHQILAINRAEGLKILSVKIVFPQSFWDHLKTFCRKKWLSQGLNYSLRTEIFEDALEDSIQRLISPFVTRQIRNGITEQAAQSAVCVFSENLKNLLLTSPLRGKVVLAIDPGIKNGCKMAVVSPHGQVLHVGKFKIVTADDVQHSTDILIDCVKNFNCETIGLGNGTYSRQTEEFLSQLIKSGRFLPLDVRYTMVDEQGVSVYSCSRSALNEFPGTDPTLISAVSLARRLQDPLAELVKVEPRHLGVGMYQHDIPEKQLTSSLDEVVSECVSFVGIDINTASLDLLRRVAGFSKKRAEAIASHRIANGPFQNRDQLLKVKGIGSKTYQQCAGFIRILPATAISNEHQSSSKKKLNPLDRTEIHPEDYNIAVKLITDCKLDRDNVGTPKFISTVKNVLSTKSIADLSSDYGVSEAKMTQITDALKRAEDEDLRSLSQGPLFLSGVTTLESLKPGDVLTGVVKNVVQFGAFVDVGVGVNGLIHSSHLGRDRSRWVQLGDRVDVNVVSVDCKAKRLGLTIRRKH